MNPLCPDQLYPHIPHVIHEPEWDYQATRPSYNREFDKMLCTGRFEVIGQ